MGTLQQQLQKAEKLNPQDLVNIIFNFLASIEDDVFDLNIKQMDQGYNAEGDPLINDNKKFDGVYSKFTADIAAIENPILPKKEGELYNFGWLGDYLANFEMKLFDDHLQIYSTGEGVGEKKDFFNGYKSLYGLTPNNIKFIIETKLLPFLINTIRLELGI